MFILCLPLGDTITGCHILNHAFPDFLVCNFLAIIPTKKKFSETIMCRWSAITFCGVQQSYITFELMLN